MGTQWVDRMGGRIGFEESGDGPLVICIPSIGDVRGEYRYLAPQLVQAGFRVIEMDIRGMGESSASWDEYTVESMGGDILALIRALKAGPASVIGTSMAAAAGVWAAVEQPEAISGLVLIGPAVHGTVTGINRLLFSILFSKPWGPTVWTKYYSTLYPSRKPKDFIPYITALRDHLREPGRTEALVASILAPKTAAEERLTQVRVPVQVIMGSKDPDFKDPEAEARWVAQQLHGEVHIVQGAGHYPHAEMPEIIGPLVIGALNSFLMKEGDGNVAKSRIR